MSPSVLRARRELWLAWASSWAHSAAILRLCEFYARTSFFSAMAVTAWAFSGFAVRTGIRHWSTAESGKTDWNAVITDGGLMLMENVLINLQNHRRLRSNTR